LPGRFIVIAAIDNLVKGSAGQAIQNLNVVHGWREDTAIAQAPLFP
jgi:N-acetyl-gamma-glutamyl-phosphate reductase